MIIKISVPLKTINEIRSDLIKKIKEKPNNELYVDFENEIVNSRANKVGIETSDNVRDNELLDILKVFSIYETLNLSRQIHKLSEEGLITDYLVTCDLDNFYYSFKI